MDTDKDFECTCDIGPFATCPLCRGRVEVTEPSKGNKPPRYLFSIKDDEAWLADRLTSIKLGYRF